MFWEIFLSAHNYYNIFFLSLTKNVKSLCMVFKKALYILTDCLSYKTITRFLQCAFSRDKWCSRRKCLCFLSSSEFFDYVLGQVQPNEQPLHFVFHTYCIYWRWDVETVLFQSQIFFLLKWQISEYLTLHWENWKMKTWNGNCSGFESLLL